MRSAADLHSQIASIVEVLANAAVAQICAAVETEYAAVTVEMSRGQRENECLRRRVKLLELQVSRVRAEQRLKAQDGAGTGRLFPGMRLLQHRPGSKDAPAGSGLQIRPRFLNRPQQKSNTDLDQDRNQEVVTTTKTEPTEPEDDDDLIIVKVEGSVSLQDDNNNNNTSTNTSSTNTSSSSSSTSLAQSSEIQAQSSSQTENRKSQEHSRSICLSEEQMVKREGNLKTSFPHQRERLHPVTTDTNPQPLVNPASHRSERASPADDDAKATLEVLAFNVGEKSSSRFHLVSAVQTKASAQTRRAADAFADGFLNFPCLFCPRRFAQEKELFSHESVHRATRPFQCDQCPRVFESFCHLKRHKLVHTGARPYPCAHCGKRYSTFNNLKVHQSVHTGERKFKCQTCRKTYAFHSNLIRHQAVHRKEQRVCVGL